MTIEIHHAALKALRNFPTDVLFRAREAFTFLELGESISMPLSRPMPSVWSGCHELRISDRYGTYRIFYVMVISGTIFVPHCFHKKTAQTLAIDIKLAKRRTKEFLDGRKIKGI